MAKIKERGKSGAAKNYTTRNQALKKLQCSLSDFRRLCILKGIFPRVPTSAKRANKGSSAPASFYYAKDIQYLLHEPVLAKLREHKAFAKKLSRAIGRGEWSLAKGLEERRPVYRLDHILKERYPTFPDALRDLPDALSLLSLFALLTTTPTPTSTLPPTLTINCARLMAEWKLYVMRSKCLRKVFFSIKGVYYQVEIGGEKVTWLEGYAFTQHVPTDVDFRILLTFLELHQTLLGFVLFKLYTDINLVYPPPLDQAKDEAGAGYGAFTLSEKPKVLSAEVEAANVAAEGEKKKVTAREVKKGIRSIANASTSAMVVDEDESALPAASTSNAVEEEDFVVQPSKSDPSSSSALPTFSTLSSNSASTSSLNSLFSPYTFYISRSVPRQTVEFILRSFGSSRIGWDVATLGEGADFTDPNDPSITHVIVDRPVIGANGFVWSEGGETSSSSSGSKRAFVQPQWVVDCANEARLLPTGEYAPGATLPPHLSPFGKGDGRGEFAADSRNAGLPEGEEAALEEVEEEDSEEEEDEDAEMTTTTTYPPALLAASQDPTNELLLHAAELEAEQLSTPLAEFEESLAKATKEAVKTGTSKAKGKSVNAEEEDLRRIMMTQKNKKLYEKMEHGNKIKSDEQINLERKRQVLKKEKAKKDKKEAGKGKSKA
ncbi:Pescadillo N-terminus-domain-containing protein [Mrakia frigida]|uniref:mRNA-binding ribosome synthesis protein NOP7 n=1 Tax=Mrakia frigida TaxID=29902 RepID=UPI003FCC0D59